MLPPSESDVATPNASPHNSQQQSNHGSTNYPEDQYQITGLPVPESAMRHAARLLFNHLAANTEHTVATLLINLDNEASLRVARRLGCQRQPDLDGNAYFKTEFTR
jgi:hypothetical protein